MRRLDLEFQPRRSSPLAWSLLVLGGAIVAVLVLLQQHLQTEQVALETRVHGLELQLGRRPATAAPQSSAASREQAENLAQMRSVSQQLQQGDFLFVLAEPRRSVLLLAAGGAWQQVLAQGCADSDQALQALIERTCELYGEQMPRVYLHAPGRGDVPQLAAVQLCQPASEADPLCAMWRAVA